MQFLGLIARLLSLNLLDPSRLLFVNFLKASLKLFVARLFTQEHILDVLPDTVTLSLSHGFLLVSKVLGLLSTCQFAIGQRQYL